MTLNRISVFCTFSSVSEKYKGHANIKLTQFYAPNTVRKTSQDIGTLSHKQENMERDVVGRTMY